MAKEKATRKQGTLPGEDIGLTTFLDSARAGQAASVRRWLPGDSRGSENRVSPIEGFRSPGDYISKDSGPREPPCPGHHLPRSPTTSANGSPRTRPTAN